MHIFSGPKKEKEADNTDGCKHLSVQPKFDEELAQHMDEFEIRKTFPRFEGSCPECGKLLILYASAAHFVMGDW